MTDTMHCCICCLFHCWISLPPSLPLPFSLPTSLPLSSPLFSFQDGNNTPHSAQSVAVVAGATVAGIVILLTVIITAVVSGLCCLNPTCPFYKWRMHKYQNVS